MVWLSMYKGHNSPYTHLSSRSPRGGLVTNNVLPDYAVIRAMEAEVWGYWLTARFTVISINTES